VPQENLPRGKVEGIDLRGVSRIEQALAAVFTQRPI
jgi:hypothetical protein